MILCALRGEASCWKSAAIFTIQPPEIDRCRVNIGGVFAARLQWNISGSSTVAKENEAYPTALKREAIRHVMAGASLTPAACRHGQKHPPFADAGGHDAGTARGTCGRGFALATADRGRGLEYDRRLSGPFSTGARLHLEADGDGDGRVRNHWAHHGGKLCDLLSLSLAVVEIISVPAAHWTFP